MPVNKKGHILVDFHGTLCVWRGSYDRFGPPILPMVQRVRSLIQAGYEVKIFTAAVSHTDKKKNEIMRGLLAQWCAEHIGQVLDVTNQKTLQTIQIYDDKAIEVIKDTGMTRMEYEQRRRRRA